MTTPGRETVGTKRQQGTAGGKKNFIFLKRKKKVLKSFFYEKRGKSLGKKIEERNQQEERQNKKKTEWSCGSAWSCCDSSGIMTTPDTCHIFSYVGVKYSCLWKQREECLCGGENDRFLQDSSSDWVHRLFITVCLYSSVIIHLWLLPVKKEFFLLPSACFQAVVRLLWFAPYYIYLTV